MVSSVVTKFGCCLPAYGPKKFILYLSKKVECYLCFGIIIPTCFVYLLDLLIKDPLLGAYFPYALKEFPEIVHRGPGLKPLIIEGKPFNNIVSQSLRCPNSELCALRRFNTVSHRNHNIQIIILYRFIGICNVQKMHIAFLRKFTIFKNITYVLGDNSPIPLE